MARDVPVSDRILVVLLAAKDREEAISLDTHEVARRAGITMNSIMHTMPVLLERGHLDPRTRSGTLKLSGDGALAARSIVAASAAA